MTLMCKRPGNYGVDACGLRSSIFCVDVPLSTIPLQPGRACSFRQLLTLPSHPPHRNYLGSSIAYVGIFIDPDNAVSEESDDNNGPYTGKFPGKPEQAGWDDFSVPTLVTESASVVEGNGEFSVLEFQINIEGVDPAVYDREVSFNFATEDGTASYRENDYLSNNGEIRISPSSSSSTLHVYVYGDNVAEPDEDMWLNFSNAKNAYTNQNHARGVIIDDD